MSEEARRFPDPYSITTPPGAEGWEDMYSYHNLFQEGRRAEDSKKTWFRNSLHYPEVSFPFDQITIDGAFTGTGVTNTRVFALPPAKGLDVRIINGYTYMSTLPPADAEEQARRAQEFEVRAGHYFSNWDTIYADWKVRVEDRIAEVRDLEVPELAEFEDQDKVLNNPGPSQGNLFLANYNRLIEACDQIWTYHSEFLNLGYAAYMQFMVFCQEHFPEIEEQTISQMVSGIDVLLFRPDQELRGLAILAEHLGIGDQIIGKGTQEELDAALGDSENGRQWLADLEERKDPWFYFSYGSGMYHHHRSWIDDMSLPIRTIGDYITHLREGDDLVRPTEKIAAERDQISSQYRALLGPEQQQEFDGHLTLARTVFPFVEDHNFYIEHWFMTYFWNKVREFSAKFVEWGFWEDIEDIFYLRRAEVEEAAYDIQMAWGAGGKPQGGFHWPEIIERRKEIYQALTAWNPPPALGELPGDIAEPLTIMLWGITPETVERWLDAQDGQLDKHQLQGFAGAPGVVEGIARVVLSPEGLDEVKDGEILIAPVTSPSWTPIFNRVRATVSDIGGIMCHAAIVSREYGVPAVVGTGFGTQQIKTGQRIRVNGDKGTVTILN